MFDSLARMLARFSRPRPGTDHDRKGPHLRVEPLEDRLVPSTISGYVYSDLNHSGWRTQSDPGIAGNTIVLYNSSGQQIASTATDANGYYQFTADQTINTAASQTQEQDVTIADSATGTSATQTLQQFDPSKGTLTGVEIVINGEEWYAAWVENTAPQSTTAQVQYTGQLNITAGGQAVTLTLSDSRSANLNAYDGNAADSSNYFQGKQLTGSQSVTLSSGQHDLSAFEGKGTVTVSFSSGAASSVSGSGNMQSVVQSVAGARVQVIYHYLPSNALRDGTYYVVQPQNPGGYADGQNTSNYTWVAKPVNGVEVIQVQIVNGSNSIENDFGEIKLASVSGYVYADNNRDQVFDSGDQGLGGVTVWLSGTNYLGQAVSQSTTTAADGSYSFGNLLPGTYAVSKGAVSGYTDEVSNVGSLGGSVVGGTIWFNLNAGDNGTSYNFGEVAATTTTVTPSGGGTTISTDVPSKRLFLADNWMYG